MTATQEKTPMGLKSHLQLEHVVKEELWAIAAASRVLLGFLSEWWHTQAKPGKLSITQCVCSSDQIPSEGSNKTSWKKDYWSSTRKHWRHWLSILDPSEHNTGRVFVALQNKLFPQCQSLISPSSASTFWTFLTICAHISSPVWLKGKGRGIAQLKKGHAFQASKRYFPEKRMKTNRH